MLSDPDQLSLPARPAARAGDGVAVWREPVTIPTYRPLPPSRFPAYLDRRVYQGSSGRVYPLPMHDRISTDREPVEWDAVHLENAWLRVMVLPQIGGRVHVAQDRSSGYHFFYLNPVIKPALVGLAGPWIAGGVEFNWPQHHRPATFLPTDVEIEEEPDGSVTVWCSDHDPFTRMKGMHGVRLRPDRSTLEVRVRLYNRSELTQSFLWWANVAARVDEDYQSFFPPDVHLVADHARRAVTGFPAADGPYYGIDYPARRGRVETAADGSRVAGDRIDWIRNIPVPTSYMCLGSHGDFFGGYDHAAGAGFVHVADHAQAVGKKQWTWGSSDFGRAWCRNLADDGAAYAELMAGVFTDNQPDFAFIAPGETKVFAQTWYPISGTGPVDAATVDAALRVRRVTDPDPGIVASVVVTSPRSGCVVEFGWAGGRVERGPFDLQPGPPHVEVLPVGAAAGDGPDAGDAADVTVVVRDADGELVRAGVRVPTAEVDHTTGLATAPAAPGEVGSVEELVLVGTHLEQYRHATRSPEPYWVEALVRDPGNLAASVGLALRAYRRGRFERAEHLLRAALARATTWNANPRDTEVLYLLGLVRERRDDDEAAGDAYAAASWDRRWRAPAGYRLARMAARAGRDRVALDRLEDVLRAEPDHLQARALSVVLLRRLGRRAEADRRLESARRLDPLDWWTRDLAGLPLSTDAQTCLDLALEYRGVGEWAAALRLLDAVDDREAERAVGQPATTPLSAYHRGAVLDRLDRPTEAARARTAARAADPSWCFPSRLDDAAVLERAARVDPTDARSRALLGHLLYAADRHEEALTRWQSAVQLDPDQPVVWRNIGLARHNDLADLPGAREAYDRALAADPDTAQLVSESDQLDIRRGVAPTRRLDRLLARRAVVLTRDDTTAALADLLVCAGRAAEAEQVLLGRLFQPWEGGEGAVLRTWERVCLRLARDAAPTAAGGRAAVRAIRRALDPPESLGEARHPLADPAELWLALGDALDVSGDADGAAEAWRSAAGLTGGVPAAGPPPCSETSFWGVLALHRLGRTSPARARTAELRAFTDALRTERATVDYFATSLPSLLLFTGDPDAARRSRVTYLRAQLDLLAGEPDPAQRRLRELLDVDPNHLPAIDLLSAAGPMTDPWSRPGATTRDTIEEKRT